MAKRPNDICTTQRFAFVAEKDGGDNAEFWFSETAEKGKFMIGYGDFECFEVLGRAFTRRLVDAMNFQLRYERE